VKSYIETQYVQCCVCRQVSRAQKRKREAGERTQQVGAGKGAYSRQESGAEKREKYAGGKRGTEN